jgi:hypothetical protein
MAKNIPTPGAPVPFKKGWQEQPIQVPVLAINQLDEKELSKAIKHTVDIVSAKQAIAFVEERQKKNETYWSFTWLDTLSRWGALRFRGVELFWLLRRQMVTVNIEPPTPIPEERIKDPEDAWVRQDVHVLSARQARRPTLSLLKDYQDRAAGFEREIKSKDIVIGEQDLLISELKQKLREARNNDNRSSAKKKARKATSSRDGSQFIQTEA